VSKEYAYSAEKGRCEIQGNPYEVGIYIPLPPPLSTSKHDQISHANIVLGIPVIRPR